MIVAADPTSPAGIAAATALANAQADVDALTELRGDVAGTAGTAAGASSTDITSRLRIVIDANAESDAGVTFGAMVRIQQGEGQQGATNGARFYAKSGGLEVGVGNIWGAL
ncbi:hypothetical protein [Lentibacter algarum]|uniref:hypothetical protein n=1 Tax=Lentibacter algarum TaxID=576131 RepID=UPI00235755D6|nr:hypothetical protein [Lentibacter algarum]MCO4828889.1 hypothetical protein [Lentibacter algarum]